MGTERAGFGSRCPKFGSRREAAPGWRVHRLSGARRNEWSVSVSGNWRITFEERDGGIERVNLEDYH